MIQGSGNEEKCNLVIKKVVGGFFQMTLGRLLSEMVGLCVLIRSHLEAGCKLHSHAWHAEIHLALRPMVLCHLLWCLGLFYMFYVGSPECILIDIKGIGPSFVPSNRINHMHRLPALLQKIATNLIDSNKNLPSHSWVLTSWCMKLSCWLCPAPSKGSGDLTILFFFIASLTEFAWGFAHCYIDCLPFILNSYVFLCILCAQSNAWDRESLHTAVTGLSSSLHTQNICMNYRPFLLLPQNCVWTPEERKNGVVVKNAGSRLPIWLSW